MNQDLCPTTPSQLTDRIATFPANAGVYLMKDKKGHIIYVGKAKNLKNRVRQYFTEHDTRYQIRFLVSRIDSIDFIQTHTESEALLLENSLIKKHRPRYNVFLKDDKSYKGLKITLAHKFPRLLETRRLKKDGALYYGPFTSAEGLRDVRDFIYRHFKLRTCSDADFARRTRPCLEYQIGRCLAPCVGLVDPIQYQKQIEGVRLFLDGKSRELKTHVQKLMREASQNQDYEKAASYRDLLQNMTLVLEKQGVTQLSFGFVDLIAFSRQQNKVGIAVLMVRENRLIDSRYHIQTDLGDDVECLENFITQYYGGQALIPREIVVPMVLPGQKLLQEILSQRAGKSVTIKNKTRGKRRELLELAKQNLVSHFEKNRVEEQHTGNILKTLQAKLDLKTLPARIECFDVSHHGGSEAVASMVTCVDGKMRPDFYRHFNIRGTDTQNDFAMMREVLLRRLKNTGPGWEKPDLWLIDGGKGQLSQATGVLEEMGQNDIETVAIAKGQGLGARAKGEWSGKKEEEIYLPGRKNPVRFKTGSAEIKLLQRIRDESHRFAITHHRLRMNKRITKS